MPHKFFPFYQESLREMIMLNKLGEYWDSTLTHYWELKSLYISFNLTHVHIIGDLIPLKEYVLLDI